MLSSTGIVLNSYEYDAFGNITYKTEVVKNTFFYSGYVYDEDNGLYYLRTRYYDPETSRFLNEDTFNGYYTDPLSLNKYTYCHNNPISYNDPNGTSVQSFFKGLVNTAVDAVKNIGTAIVTGVTNVVTSIKEAFTPSKQTQSAASVAQGATTSGRTPSNYLTGNSGYSGSSSYNGISAEQREAGLKYGGANIKTEIAKAQEKSSIVLSKGFENEKNYYDDVLDEITKNGHRYDERWENGQYPKDEIEWGAAGNDNWYLNDGTIHDLARAREINGTVQRGVDISFSFYFVKVHFSIGTAQDKNGNVSDYSTIGIGQGLMTPGFSISNTYAETNAPDIDILGGKSTSSSYECGFIAGFSQEKIEFQSGGKNYYGTGKSLSFSTGNIGTFQMFDHTTVSKSKHMEGYEIKYGKKD